MLRSSLLAALAFAAPIAASDFRRDVQAVLTKAGCNSGACHGNLNGKGGFRLSLRGEDAEFDHAAVVRDWTGRRVSLSAPDESLLLLKAIGATAHAGGRRFGRDSLEYQILRDWIADGGPDAAVPAVVRLTVTPAELVLIEPADSVALRAEALFSDGTVRDVTRLACFDGSNPSTAAISVDGRVTRERFGETVVQVRYLGAQATARLAFVPARPDFTWPDDFITNNYIDVFWAAKLRSLRMTPSPPCDDATFLRRVYLDVLGVLPTPGEAREFLADTDPRKRSRVIDAVLRRPEFADHWALKWSDLLRNEEKTLDAKGVRVFHGWLRQQFARGTPLNELARRVIAGRGSSYAEPPANFYRALREPYARAEAVAQVFLGTRLQCAKCHNHPFDRWTQDDYHQFAAFFARVNYRVLENRRRDENDKHQFDGEQVVFQTRDGELEHPRTGRPVEPRFLGRPGPRLPAAGDRLAALADWVADADNPFFAAAQANRVWFHLFGRGIVEPNDDFRAANPPSHPELLDALARDLAGSGYDLRHLIRVIANSRAYQTSSRAGATNADDETNFAKAMIRPVSAEALLDAVAQALEVPLRFDGYPTGTRAGQLPDLRFGQRRESPAARFLRLFGKPERMMSCECERTGDTTLIQAFQLLTGELVQRTLAESNNRIGRLIAAGADDAAVIEDLYLAALTRYPTAAERQAADEHVRGSGDRRAALEDVAWGLINAKEFLLRQ